MAASQKFLNKSAFSAGPPPLSTALVQSLNRNMNLWPPIHGLFLLLFFAEAKKLQSPKCNETLSAKNFVAILTATLNNTNTNTPKHQTSTTNHQAPNHPLPRLCRLGSHHHAFYARIRDGQLVPKLTVREHEEARRRNIWSSESEPARPLAARR
jgi:hypothetical protein